MLSYKVIESKYPDFEEIEPDKEMCSYIKAMYENNFYSAYMNKYCIGMLKYILKHNSSKYAEEFELLEEVYTKLKL